MIDEADTADNDDDAKPTKVYQFAWQKDDEQEGEGRMRERCRFRSV